MHSTFELYSSLRLIWKGHQHPSPAQARIKLPCSLSCQTRAGCVLVSWVRFRGRDILHRRHSDGQFPAATQKRGWKLCEVYSGVEIVCQLLYFGLEGVPYLFWSIPPNWCWDCVTVYSLIPRSLPWTSLLDTTNTPPRIQPVTYKSFKHFLSCNCTPW